MSEKRKVEIVSGERRSARHDALDLCRTRLLAVARTVSSEVSWKHC
jgi:hypothetical protein